MIIPSLFKVMENMVRLIGQELQLACASMITMIVLAFVFFSLLASLWICLAALLFVYLVSLSLSWIAALFIISLINILALAIIAGILMKMKKENFFPGLKRMISDE
jgi:uncharacterized membrane protein